MCDLSHAQDPSLRSRCEQATQKKATRKGSHRPLRNPVATTSAIVVYDSIDAIQATMVSARRTQLHHQTRTGAMKLTAISAASFEENVWNVLSCASFSDGCLLISGAIHALRTVCVVSAPCWHSVDW